MLSKPSEIEQLMKEKSDLEDESRRLDEEQKKLSLRVKMLCSKLTQELKKKNSEKQQTVGQLQAEIGNLEAQLDKLSVAVASEETRSKKGDVKQNEDAAESLEEDLLDVDDSVTVAEIEEEIELTSRQDRKKRKFF